MLALHGGMGGHDQSWLLARALLADVENYRVIAVSRPGYLETSLSVGSSPQEQADMYADLLDALQIPAAIVAAVSAGGPSAIQFAVRHPTRCRALVMVSTCSGHLETPPRIAARLHLMKVLSLIPGLAALMRRRMRQNPDAAAQRAIPDPALRRRTLAHPVASPLLKALQLSVFDRLRKRLPGTINDTALFSRLNDLPLDEITAPVLVVHGRADSVVPFSHAEAIVQRAPRAEMLAVEEGEHVVLFTHLDAVRAATARFVQTHLPKS